MYLWESPHVSGINLRYDYYGREVECFFCHNRILPTIYHPWLLQCLVKIYYKTRMQRDAYQTTRFMLCFTLFRFNKFSVSQIIKFYSFDELLEEIVSVGYCEATFSSVYLLNVGLSRWRCSEEALYVLASWFLWSCWRLMHRQWSVDKRNCQHLLSREKWPTKSSPTSTLHTTVKRTHP